MTISDIAINKERQRALGDILIAECKSLSCSINTVEAILQNGASINYKNYLALKVAAKALNFNLLKFLIDKVDELSDLAISYITSMCDYKGFNEQLEPKYFELIDIIWQRSNKKAELFVPYINNLAVNGRLDKLQHLKDKYSLSESYIAESIYVRIIFEIINNGYEKMLRFIENNRIWADKQTVDLCASCDEWMVLEYILHKNGGFPSDKAVAQAVYLGYTMTLTVLLNAGYDFLSKPLLIKKAHQAADLGKSAGYEFLKRLQ